MCFEIVLCLIFSRAALFNLYLINIPEKALIHENNQWHKIQGSPTKVWILDKAR